MLYKAFSTKYDGIVRQLDSEIYVSNSALKVPIPNSGEPAAYKCRAVWDTGAMITVISEKLALELQLPVVSKASIQVVNGASETMIHLVYLWLPNSSIIRYVHAAQGKCFNNFDVLIGMDVITRGDFSISNFGGCTLFSFRLPSVGVTDYARQAEWTHKLKARKSERNALCPCGSGRKYKHCCGRN